MPCIFYGVILTGDDAHHHFASIKYAPALSVVFIFIPIFILQIRGRDVLLPVLRLPNGKNIALVTIIAIASSSFWAYSQIYSKEAVTRLFTPPKFHHLVVGNFIKNNTSYRDVVFSNDYYYSHPAFVIYNFFTDKAMHFADNLDIIYLKTKHITEEFTVKIFYYQRSEKEIDQLRAFLELQGLATTVTNHSIGGLLAFDGKYFLNWYRIQARKAS